MPSVSATETRTFGCQGMTAPLQRVLVRRPGGAERWAEYGWRAAPDPARLAREHEAFCARLEEAGAEVIVADPLDGNPDGVYMYDPAIVADAGAILLRPGKTGRRAEVEPMRAALEGAGVPVAAKLAAPATAEGGDTLWLDDSTLLVGRSYRTNDAGVEALAAALPGVDVDDLGARLLEPRHLLAQAIRFGGVRMLAQPLGHGRRPLAEGAAAEGVERLVLGGHARTVGPTRAATMPGA